MKRLGGAIVALLVSACSAGPIAAEPGSAEPVAAEAAAPAAVEPAPETRPAPIEAAPAPPLDASEPLVCAGALTQGGIALCRAAPGAEILVDGVSRGFADAEGWAVIGFDRDADGSALVEARDAAGSHLVGLTIAPREFDIQRVDGLPPQTVTPTEPEVLERIRRDTALKGAAASSRAVLQGWLGAFHWPLEGRISGRWGSQRVLNGEPRQPHYGVDIAAPTGTAITAPGDGMVTLARPDMHFEGGLVMIDHGQGLISYYLHLSAVEVAEGQMVAAGEPIGRVGATGRATGPHLCWRMRWRDRQLDPGLAVEGLAEARRAFALE